MRLVLGHDRHGRSRSEQAADARNIHHHVVTHIHTPLLGQFHVAVRGLGIEQEQRLAALLQVVLDHLLFVVEKIGARTGDHQQRAVVGHVILLAQQQLLDFVVLVLQRLLDVRKSFRIAAVDVLLAVAREEVDLFVLLAGHFDQRVGQILLGLRRDPFLLTVALEHGRVVRRDVVPLGDGRLLIRIHHLVLEVRRVVRVLLQEVLHLPAFVRPEEGDHVHVPVQVFQHLPGLFSQAELLRSGGVGAQAVAVGHEIDHHQQAENHQRHEDGVRAEFRRTAAQRRANIPPVDHTVSDDQQNAQNQQHRNGRRQQALNGISNQAQNDDGDAAQPKIVADLVPAHLAPLHLAD